MYYHSYIMHVNVDIDDIQKEQMKIARKFQCMQMCILFWIWYGSLSCIYIHLMCIYCIIYIDIFIHITYAIYTVYIYIHILYNICIYTWTIDKRRISYIQQTPVHSKIASGSRHPKHPTLCRVYKPNWWGYDHPLYGEPPAIYIRY